MPLVKEKVAGLSTRREVIYSDEDWELFKNLRTSALPLLDALSPLNPAIHGSLCRGDVKESSDIDIVFFDTIPEFLIEESLRPLDLAIMERSLVQATPLSAVKAHIKYRMDHEIILTWPLIPFKPREIEFYYFGGLLTLDKMKTNIRVPGINKQLLYIEPISTGHIEIRVSADNAGVLAKKLNISVDTIMERLRVLERRDKVGRTGIFHKQILSPEESFGGAFKQLVERNPATRRRLRRK